MSEPLPIPKMNTHDISSRKSSMRRYGVAVLFLIALLAIGISLRTTENVSAARNSDRYILNAGNDSLKIIFDGQTYAIRPADYKSSDTVRSVFSDSSGGQAILKLVTSSDSLSLRFADTAIWVSVVTDSDTIPTVFVVYPIQSTTHFLSLLRDHAPAGETVSAKSNQFTYSDPSDSNLVRLRTQYRLDSVAGNGDELSKIINLLHWAHTIVRHDGNSTNPTPRNALHIIQVCKDENRGVNCRMMATILNEAYLSMGFKSRHVTCMPFDKQDGDCHVITMVWSNQFGKWLYMDPTFEGTFRNAAGAYLSIAEVRDAMIRGDSLVMSDNMNWNGQPHSKSDYYRYMAKNLFRFVCPQRSEFGYESKDSVAWVYLDPFGYDSREPAKPDSTKPTRILTDYYTTNAPSFWAKPL
jgi:hypothetical protein